MIVILSSAERVEDFSQYNVSDLNRKREIRLLIIVIVVVIVVVVVVVVVVIVVVITYLSAPQLRPC